MNPRAASGAPAVKHCRAIDAGRRAASGFTLIELLIAMSVFATVVALALPGYGKMMANGKVRSTADAVVSGMSIAQAEAMRRSTNVEFLVTSASPVPANVGATAASSARNWMVRIPADATRNIASAAFVRGSADADPGAATVENRSGAVPVVFTPSGRVMLNNAGVLTAVANPVVMRVTSPSADRQLCVYATVTGTIKSCDPKLAAGDSRACLPAITAAACP